MAEVIHTTESERRTNSREKSAMAKSFIEDFQPAKKVMLRQTHKTTKASQLMIEEIQ